MAQSACAAGGHPAAPSGAHDLRSVDGDRDVHRDLGDLPFWWLVLDPRPYPLARVKQGYRILMLTFVMVPMMLAGAVLGLSRHDLYPVYGICGRFASVSALTDQQIGGLIIWIPGTVFLVSIALIVLRRTLLQEHAAQAAHGSASVL